MKIIIPLLFVWLLTGVDRVDANLHGVIGFFNSTAGHAQKGTITTIRSPVTKNVKVYRKVSRRTERNAKGLTKVFTTSTITVTTTTRRVTVIRRITTGANNSKSRT